MSWWQDLKARYGQTMEEFGRVAVGTYLVLFAGTMLGFWIAIRMGFEPAGAAAGAGTVGAAWVATKLTQPLRIGATIVATPLVAAVLSRLRTSEPALPTDD